MRLDRRDRTPLSETGSMSTRSADCASASSPLARAASCCAPASAKRARSPLQSIHSPSEPRLPWQTDAMSVVGSPHGRLSIHAGGNEMSAIGNARRNDVFGKVRNQIYKPDQAARHTQSVPLNAPLLSSQSKPCGTGTSITASWIRRSSTLFEERPPVPRPSASLMLRSWRPVCPRHWPRAQRPPAPSYI